MTHYEHSSIDISVIMSIYKEPLEWIEKSINSILKQTHDNFEFIIINDYPLRIENAILIKRFRENDKRIVYLENDKNIGLTASLNKGLRIAKGKYIARMDADDISELNRFKLQFNFMEINLDYILIGSNANLINEEDKLIGEFIYPEFHESIQANLILKNSIAHPTFFYRKEIIDKNNIEYSKDYPYAEDYNFACKMSLMGKIYNMQMKLLNYRVSYNQISKSKIKEQDIVANRIRKEYITDIIISKYDFKILKSDNIYEKISLLADDNPRDKILKNAKLSCAIYFKELNFLDRFLLLISFKYSLIDSLKILKSF